MVSSVLLAGGGSAGHVSPLLALADALRARDPDVRVTALGTSAGLEARIVPERGYELRFVPKVPLPRRPSLALLRLPGALRAAVAAARSAIDDTGAQVVVGFGGYVSTPAYLAARAARIPIVVHEQNARPGLANRLGARLTPFVATTFAQTRLPHAQVLGMPLRPEIKTFDRAALRKAALEHFGLDEGRPTLLVTGGSLGAQRLNEAVRAAAPALAQAGIQVLHITGIGKEFPVPGRGDGPDEARGEATRETTAQAPAYRVLPYLDRMELGYAAADVVLCRSGANTVCELTAVGLPAVYVPLPIGNGEQRLNAAGVVAAGGGLLVEDAELTGQWVRERLVPLIGDRAAVAAMAERAGELGHRDADERLVDLVVAAARGTSSGASGAGR